MEILNLKLLLERFDMSFDRNMKPLEMPNMLKSIAPLVLDVLVMSDRWTSAKELDDKVQKEANSVYSWSRFKELLSTMNLAGAVDMKFGTRTTDLNRYYKINSKWASNTRKWIRYDVDRILHETEDHICTLDTIFSSLPREKAQLFNKDQLKELLDHLVREGHLVAAYCRPDSKCLARAEGSICGENSAPKG